MAGRGQEGAEALKAGDVSAQDRLDPAPSDDRLAGTAELGIVPVEPAPAVRDPTTGPPEVLRELGNSPAVVSDARPMVTGAHLAWGAPEVLCGMRVCSRSALIQRHPAC